MGNHLLVLRLSKGFSPKKFSSHKYVGINVVIKDLIVVYNLVSLYRLDPFP